MSGIYIPDMKKPKSCNGCAFNLIGHCMAYKGLYVERKNLEYNSKPEWCPLVPVPPHGRLIDADALFPMYADLLDGRDVQPVIPKIVIDTAPTIIEAEDDNGQTTVLTAADVAPVRHGHCIWHADDNDYECSVCHIRCVYPLATYCPFCGAKMDESEFAKDTNVPVTNADEAEEDAE